MIPKAVPGDPSYNCEITFELRDIIATVLINDRLKRFLKDLGAPDSFIESLTKSLSDWSHGEKLTEEDRKILTDAFIKDRIADFCESTDKSDDETDYYLNEYDKVAKKLDHGDKPNPPRPIHDPPH